MPNATAPLEAQPENEAVPAPDTPSRRDLERVGTALIQLDAWCRQRGMDDLAALIEAGSDWVEARLTTG